MRTSAHVGLLLLVTFLNTAIPTVEAACANCQKSQGNDSEHSGMDMTMSMDSERMMSCSCSVKNADGNSMSCNCSMKIEATDSEHGANDTDRHATEEEHHSESPEESETSTATSEGYMMAEPASGTFTPYPTLVLGGGSTTYPTSSDTGTTPYPHLLYSEAPTYPLYSESSSGTETSTAYPVLDSTAYPVLDMSGQNVGATSYPTYGAASSAGTGVTPYPLLDPSGQTGTTAYPGPGIVISNVNYPANGSDSTQSSQPSYILDLIISMPSANASAPNTTTTRIVF